jgi:hypothetical protein
MGTPDISLAGFILTAEEWRALDAAARAELLAAAGPTSRGERWVIERARGLLAPAPMQRAA